MVTNFNRVRLCGQALNEPTLSHVNHGEAFYKFSLRVERLSGQADTLRVIVSRRQLERSPVCGGDTVLLTGQLRSFNNKSGCGSRLIISVFVQELEIVSCDTPPENQIQLSGVICKPPLLRRTPLGRDICDVILAVNRRYGRADYLPCIAWGIVAQQVGDMTVGERLIVEGRIQSRCYTKNLGSYTEERIAYEVSIMRPAAMEEFAVE